MCDQCHRKDAANARPRRAWVRWVVLLAALVGLLASLAEGAQPTAPRGALLPAVVVESVRVDPVALEETDITGSEWLRQAMATQAVASARRAALDEQLAATVPSPSQTSTATALRILVTSPLQVAPGASPPGGAARKTNLVTARVELAQPGAERVMAVGEARLAWKDLRWTRGAGRERRTRAVEAVLLEAVGEAVERATRELTASLRGPELPGLRERAEGSGHIH